MNFHRNTFDLYLYRIPIFECRPIVQSRRPLSHPVTYSERQTSTGRPPFFAPERSQYFLLCPRARTASLENSTALSSPFRTIYTVLKKKVGQSIRLDSTHPEHIILLTGCIEIFDARAFSDSYLFHWSETKNPLWKLYSTGNIYYITRIFNTLSVMPVGTSLITRTRRILSTAKYLLQKGVAHYLGQNILDTNHRIDHIAMEIMRATWIWERCNKYFQWVMYE